jgi:hypothetical protein
MTDTIVNGHERPPDKPLEWNGRAVTLVEFSIREGRDVRAAYQKDGETGMWSVLVKSARYADDDTPLFASVDEVEAQPFRLHQRLMRIAARALDLNGFMIEGQDGKDENRPSS